MISFNWLLSFGGGRSDVQGERRGRVLDGDEEVGGGPEKWAIFMDVILWNDRSYR